MKHAATILASLIGLIFCLPSHGQGSSSLSQYEGKALSDSDMADAVTYIEAHAKMPEGASDIGAYGRYYAQDKGIVYGEYVKLWPGEHYASGTHIVAYDKLPGILDGGCDVIDIIYIPSNHAIGADCHGYG